MKGWMHETCHNLFKVIRRARRQVMYAQSAADLVRSPYQLSFLSLFRGNGFAFPCDEAGRVDLDAMSDKQRNAYLYARALIGRELAYPVVRPADTCLR